MKLETNQIIIELSIPLRLHICFKKNLLVLLSKKSSFMFGLILLEPESNEIMFTPTFPCFLELFIPIMHGHPYNKDVQHGKDLP